MRSKRFLWLLMALTLGVALVTCRPGLTSATPPPDQATLLVYNTVEQLLAGDLLHTVTISEVQTHLADYPPDWPLVGLGTTDWIGRNGELMPDATAGAPHFWWADPGSPSQADVIDLTDYEPPAQFPFLALAIGDPATAITLTLQNVPDVHAWLEEKLETSGIDLVGVQLRGQFGPVKTSVAYNIPLTGLDLSGGYVGEDVFRFGEHTTATWTMNGLYAADPTLQPVISTPGHPLHLHGYQPDTMLGGHIGSASAISATATVWPMTGVVAGTSELDSLRLLDELVRIPGPSLDEGAVTRHVADLLTSWGISTTLNVEEPWVVGHLPGSGPKVALIAHLDEPRYLLTDVDEDGVATFDGVYYAPTWDRAELRKFLTYEGLAEAPIVRNPDGDVRLALYVPEWEASLPVLSWTVRDVQHQIATVPLNNEQAAAASEALAEGHPLVAINQNGLRRVTDPLVGDLVLGSPLDNRVGAALILSQARRYAALDPADRPDLTIVGRPREEHPAPSTFLFIPPIADADLVIVVDAPAPERYPTLGSGPVVVWDADRTPAWVMDALSPTPRPEGHPPPPLPSLGEGEGGRGGGGEGQIFEADDPAFLTAVANDAGPDVPALLVGPTMLRYHSSQEKMAVADVEGSERLLMTLLDRIAQRPANPLTLALSPADVLHPETTPGTVSDRQTFALRYAAVTNSGPVTVTLTGLEFDLLCGSQRVVQQIYDRDAISESQVLAPGETVVLADWFFEPDARLKVDGLRVTARGYTLDTTPVEARAGVAVAPREEAKADYRAAFRRAVQANFADPTLFHDPHGLGTLGLLRDEIIAEFGQAQYDDWLAHAIAETCIIETPDGWAAQGINAPDLPALPQCNGQPGYHDTNMFLLALNWLGWDGLPQTDWDPDSPTGTRTWTIPKEEFVRWLQANIQPEPYSPGLAAQALIASGVPITQTWTANDGQSWTVETWLDQVIEDWRAERAELDLKPGDFIPDRLMHVAPSLIELLKRYPEYTSKYGPVLDEALAYYRSLLTEDGYWHFPGEAYDAGHIIEQYVRAQQAGMNIALPTLRPIELMVQHQQPNGFFDLGFTNYIGAQAHGVRALGVTLPLLSSPYE